MAALDSFDAFVARMADCQGHYRMWGENSAAAVALFSPAVLGMRYGAFPALPTPLPTGVTAYICTGMSSVNNSSTFPMLVGKKVSFGSIDISTNVWTPNGSATMPTKTVLGASRTLSSALFGECTVALSATPGSLVVGYNDQAGAAQSQTNLISQVTATRSICQFPLLPASSGVQAITSVSRTGGTTPTGTIELFGVMPLIISLSNSGSSISGVTQDNFLTTTFAPARFGAGDQLSIWLIASSPGAKVMTAEASFVGDA